MYKKFVMTGKETIRTHVHLDVYNGQQWQNKANRPHRLHWEWGGRFLCREVWWSSGRHHNKSGDSTRVEPLVTLLKNGQWKLKEHVWLVLCVCHNWCVTKIKHNMSLKLTIYFCHTVFVLNDIKPVNISLCSRVGAMQYFLWLQFTASPDFSKTHIPTCRWHELWSPNITHQNEFTTWFSLIGFN